MNVAAQGMDRRGVAALRAKPGRQDDRARQQLPQAPAFMRDRGADHGTHIAQPGSAVGVGPHRGNEIGEAIGNQPIARHLVLQPARAGIGGATEHEQPFAEAVGAFHERLQRIRPHQRIDGEAVGFEVAAAAGGRGRQIGPGIG